MPLSTTLFDRAFGIWQEFGPERRRSVEERWAERLPELDRRAYVGVAERCRAVEAAAFALASAVLDGDLSESEAVARLKALYPDLSEERVSQTWSQARYFSMK